MIRDVFKYLLIGTQDTMDQFFEKAQEEGFLEFITLAAQKEVLSASVAPLVQAIKILKKQPLTKEVYPGGGDQVLALQLAERVVECKREVEKLQEESRLLETERVRVLPFGYFSMDEVQAVEKAGKRKIQFFCRKVGEEAAVSDEVVHIATEYDLDYFISIAERQIAPAGMIEMHLTASLGEIEEKQRCVQTALARAEHELKVGRGYLDFLEQVLIDVLNTAHLRAAKKGIRYPMENALFAIEAWVPEHKLEALARLMGDDLIGEQIAVEPHDKVPTCLDNRGSLRIGEDLISIYDTPATTDKDPSGWVLWFFVLFFAVIVGDGGYGLIFLGFALYLKTKFPDLKGQGKRILKLVTILSAACIAWGALTSSYFGLKLSPDSAIAKFSPLRILVERKADFHLKHKDDVYTFWLESYPQIAHATSGKAMLAAATQEKKHTRVYPMIDEFSSNIILEFTLIIGIVHIALGFCRYLKRHVAGLGWIFFMIGGYLFFPMMLNATTIAEFMGWVSKPVGAAFGLQCLYGGLAFALLGSLVQHRLRGLGEIANLVQVFADVLSYLRLYALSLAGAIMASTFNQEGSALGLFFGFLAILIGHGVNILLAIMGGIIHGLRLNFLEWYHYCFDGGGRLFNPLRKLKKG